MSDETSAEDEELDDENITDPLTGDESEEIDDTEDE